MERMGTPQTYTADVARLKVDPTIWMEWLEFGQAVIALAAFMATFEAVELIYSLVDSIVQRFYRRGHISHEKQAQHNYLTTEMFNPLLSGTVTVIHRGRLNTSN